MFSGSEVTEQCAGCSRRAWVPPYCQAARGIGWRAVISWCMYEVWLKRNRTARADHKVGGPSTSETLDINLYHIVEMCAIQHLDIAIILLSTALCFIDDADAGHSGLDVLD